MTVTMPQGADHARLVDHLEVLRNRWRWAAVPFIGIVLLAAGFGMSRPATYEATASVLVGNDAVDEVLGAAQGNASVQSRALSNELSVARSDLVADRAAAVLGHEIEVSVSGSELADVLEFRATSTNAEMAALHANTWAQEYVNQKQADSVAIATTATERLRTQLEDLRSERDALRSPIDALEDRLAATVLESAALSLQREIDRETERIALDLTLLEGEISAIFSQITQLQVSGELSSGFGARIIESAEVPKGPTSLPTWFFLAVGMVVGAMVAVGSAFLRESLDHTIRTAADVSALVSIPVLGSIPRDREIQAGRELVEDRPTSAAAQAYNEVRAALRFLILTDDVHLLGVTSPNPSEGKTTVAANVAAAVAALDRRTLAVDTDLRRPRLDNIFGVPRQPGLSEHVLDGVAVDDLVHERTSNLSVLTSGTLPPNPADFLASPALEPLLGSLRSDFDTVVFDTAPVSPLADTLALAPRIDGMIVVVRAGSTKHADLRRTIDNLTKVGARVFGIVIVGVVESRKSYYYTDSTGELANGSSSDPEESWGDDGEQDSTPASESSRSESSGSAASREAQDGTSKPKGGNGKAAAARNKPPGKGTEPKKAPGARTSPKPIRSTTVAPLGRGPSK
ncbi:MAG: polysaccharide biosynthesis tyrosine autokinase [Actinomycetia bacterium]|nr:polysaccharide biosynthesis tyrosine autokinase [Actinomycetes bacterium]